MKDLDCDDPLGAMVLGAKDGTHRARAKLFQDLVATCQ
jgi:hypothetical protein